MSKESDEYFVFVGFPVTSLEKFTPADATVESLEEKLLVVHLSPDVLPNDATQDVMQKQFEHWKMSVPVPDSKRKAGKDSNKQRISHSELVEGLSLDELAQRIIAFPMESRTPMECMLFLADIRSQLLSQGGDEA